MTSRRLFGIVLAIAALSLYLAPTAYAQAGMGKAHRMYDPATETTVSGTIEEVHTIAGRGGWSGVHLTLKTEEGDFDVHVGPAAYVEKEHFTFAKGDEIEVTGSKVMYEEHDAIIAREIVKDGETLTLRDAHGYPEWAGRWRDTSK
jgi:hypothetical protein